MVAPTVTDLSATRSELATYGTVTRVLDAVTVWLVGVVPVTEAVLATCAAVTSAARVV